MNTPDQERETDWDIVPENASDAEEVFRRNLASDLVLRDIARRISEGVDPEEAVKQAKALAEGKADE
jgi:hypothetical protein